MSKNFGKYMITNKHKIIGISLILIGIIFAAVSMDFFYPYPVLESEAKTYWWKGIITGIMILIGLFELEYAHISKKQTPKNEKFIPSLMFAIMIFLISTVIGIIIFGIYIYEIISHCC